MQLRLSLVPERRYRQGHPSLGSVHIASRLRFYGDRVGVPGHIHQLQRAKAVSGLVGGGISSVPRAWPVHTHVTNGYMTLDTLWIPRRGGAGRHERRCERQCVRGAAIPRGIDVEKVWQSCSLARELDVHLEITTLVIPAVNDSDESLAAIARGIVTDQGCLGAPAATIQPGASPLRPHWWILPDGPRASGKRLAWTSATWAILQATAYRTLFAPDVGHCPPSVGDCRQ